MKIPTQNFFILLLMLMSRIVLATVCGRFRSWGLVKMLNFCSDFEHKVWSRFWNWSSGKIWGWPVFFCWSFVEVMKLNLSQDSEARFGQNLKLTFYGESDVWLRFWSWCLVEILKMNFYQDLYLNLWYQLNPRVRCACLWQCFIHIWKYLIFIKNLLSQ